MSDGATDAGQGENETRRAPSPRSALSRLRENQASRLSEQRQILCEAMLIACGEQGFHAVPVGLVLERTGVSMISFYRLFAHKSDCYAKAYAEEIERLSEMLLQVGAEQPCWAAGLRAALAQLGTYLSERPLLARGVLVEVRAADEPAPAKREEVFERLSRALDSARREPESHHSPPPITAAFIVSAIEESAVRALLTNEPGRFAVEVPDLAEFIEGIYFAA
jgi:AcrR family transcriptional regulator